MNRHCVAWLLIVAGWVLTGISVPVDGAAGFALGLTGIVLFAVSVRVLRKAGTR